jgi:HAD superfamily phosphatase (TIGR01668 family)
MSRITSLGLQIWFFLTAPLRRKIVTHTASSVHQINYQELKDRGVELIIFDLDDTLANWRTTIPKDVLSLFHDIQEVFDFSIAIFSNTTKRRVKKVRRDLDQRIVVIQTPSKPITRGFKKLIEHYDITPEKTAMVGDRLATDMWGAKRAGITTRILVEPYSKYMEGRHSPCIQKIIRALEKFLNGHYFR